MFFEINNLNRLKNKIGSIHEQLRHRKLLTTVRSPVWEDQPQQKRDKDQRGRRQHPLRVLSPALLFFTTSYWELWSLPLRQLSHICPALFPAFKDKNAANNLFYICSKYCRLQEHLCLPALPSWYGHAEPPYTCLYFFQISVPFLSKLICDKSLVSHGLTTQAQSH